MIIKNCIFNYSHCKPSQKSFEENFYTYIAKFKVILVLVNKNVLIS